MPDATRIEKWIKQIDIDYYSYFIKAWIPFNAWYRDNYPNKDSDRATINEIKRTGNRFRDTIVLLLNDQGVDGTSFKMALSNLHNALNSVSIDCKQKYKENYSISLMEICVENNPTETISELRNKIRYFVRRDRNSDEIQVNVKDSNNNSKLSINPHPYSEKVLQDDRDYIKLSVSQQGYLINFYKQVNPWYPCNLLFDSNRDYEANKIQCGNTSFTSDRILLAKGIIECLYLLRNTLLHGELTPCENARIVYKCAYDILFTIVKKLN